MSVASHMFNSMRCASRRIRRKQKQELKKFWFIYLISRICPLPYGWLECRRKELIKRRKNMEICFKIQCIPGGFCGTTVSVCRRVSVTFRRGDTQVLGPPRTICFCPPAQTPTTVTCQKSWRRIHDYINHTFPFRLV